jgi:two-component system cell cycle sensor histidine kinase/response regulator CckA
MSAPTVRAPSLTNLLPQQTLLDHLTQSVFLKDRDLRFVVVNRAFCAGLGREPGEVLGQDDFAFYPRGLAEKYRADDLRILEGGVTLETEEQNLHAGKLCTVRVVKSPVYGEGGARTGVLGIFWDVTEQRHLERQQRHAQKMHAVAQLAGGIAHDFNNLLTGILANVALAQVELSDLPGLPTGGVFDVLKHAENVGHRAAALTRQLLQFSRRVKPKPEALDVNECVRRALAAYPPPAQLELRTHLERLGLVHADAGQCHQVLRHLLANAVEAMPDGGTLTVATGNVTLVPEAALHHPRPGPAAHVLPVCHPEARPGEYVRLRVADTGGGIASEARERLFEPFFSMKEPGKGAGLGLALAYSIVKDHDGWIECHSDEGAGAHFDVFLPRLLAPLPAAGAGLDGRGHETILIVDEHEVVRTIAREILEGYGYRVLAAANSAAAIELYRQRGEEIDLILVDLTLPRTDAAETLSHVRRLRPAAPVLVCAAYPAGPAIRAVQACAAAGFVSKPFQPLELACSVRAALDRARGAAEAATLQG